MNCPCREVKCHLGIHFITPKKLKETIQELQKVQKTFFMGHGIKTNDPKEAYFKLTTTDLSNSEKS